MHSTGAGIRRRLFYAHRLVVSDLESPRPDGSNHPTKWPRVFSGFQTVVNFLVFRLNTIRAVLFFSWRNTVAVKRIVCADGEKVFSAMAAAAGNIPGGDTLAQIHI